MKDNTPKIYEKKYFTLKALDVDSTTKSVKVAIAQVREKDRDEELIVPEAFKRTIKAKGPQGSNEIWHLLDHTPNSFSALSKFSELYMENDYLVGVSKYKNSYAWREVAWPLYEGGDFTQHSIGYRVIKSQDRESYRELQELELFEGSAVLWGANPDTPTLGVTKSLTPDELISEYDELHSRMERLIKFAQSGDAFEEKKSLFEIQLRQIQQKLSDLQNATQLVEKTPDPVKDDNGLLDVFKTFNKTLNQRGYGNERIASRA